MSLDKFFIDDEKKPAGKKAKESIKKNGIRDVQGNEQVKADLEQIITGKPADEPALTIPGLEHRWEPDWLENVTKEELYYLLKETVEANRKFHHLKNYIEKQMVSKGPLDSTEMAIRLNLTEGEILILFDSIYTTRKSKDVK